MDLIPIGLQLTIYGMGIVFLLLALMAVLISLLLRFDRARDAEFRPGAIVADATHPAGLDAQAIAAIAVAVHQHRRIQGDANAPKSLSAE